MHSPQACSSALVSIFSKSFFEKSDRAGSRATSEASLPLLAGISPLVPSPFQALFFSSCLLFHTLLSLYQSWALGRVVVKGFLVLLPLSGLLVKVDLKSLLGSSVISKAWTKTSRFSDAPSTEPLQPNSLKPTLFRRKDVR